MLDRQWRSFVAEGPPTAAVRRNRIDRLMALLLDNSDAFIDAMAADYGTRSKAASLFTEIIGITRWSNTPDPMWRNGCGRPN